MHLRLPIELPLPSTGFFPDEHTINDAFAAHGDLLADALGWVLEPLPGRRSPGREVEIDGGRVDLGYRIRSGPHAGHHLYLENQNRAGISDPEHIDQVRHRLSQGRSLVIYVTRLLRETDRRTLEQLAQVHPGRLQVLVREEDRERGVLAVRAVVAKYVCPAGAKLYLCTRILPLLLGEAVWADGWRYGINRFGASSGAHNAHLVPPRGGPPVTMNFFSDRKHPGVFFHFWPAADANGSEVRRLLGNLKQALATCPRFLWWIPPMDSRRATITAGFTAAGLCAWNPDAPDAIAEGFLVRAQRVLYEALQGRTSCELGELAQQAARPVGAFRDYGLACFAERLQQRYGVDFRAL